MTNLDSGKEEQEAGVGVVVVEAPCMQQVCVQVGEVLFSEGEGVAACELLVVDLEVDESTDGNVHNCFRLLGDLIFLGGGKPFSRLH